MLKYIKWLCLIIGIIGLIILGINFINYNSETKPKEEKFKIIDIYNTAWYKRGVAYYENKELFNENLNLDDPRYMVFYENYVEYYNPMTEKTDKYDYTYNEQTQTITINSEDFFLPNGTYNIEFEDSYLKISQSIDGNDYIYYFLSAEG